VICVDILLGISLVCTAIFLFGQRFFLQKFGFSYLFSSVRSYVFPWLVTWSYSINETCITCKITANLILAKLSPRTTWYFFIINLN
jgi:hypothetical protein